MTERWMLHDMESLTVVTAKKPGRFIALCNGESFTDEENADHARLIAAAPDLLVALEAVVSLANYAGADEGGFTGHNRTEWESEIAPKARAAIAKAKRHI